MVSGHSSWVLSVAFSPDSRYFATGYVLTTCNPTLLTYSLALLFRSADKTVKVWDAAKGQCLHTFNDHSDMVLLLFSPPNGTFVALTSLGARFGQLLLTQREPSLPRHPMTSPSLSTTWPTKWFDQNNWVVRLLWCL